jgi:hypothetical protein
MEKAALSGAAFFFEKRYSLYWAKEYNSAHEQTNIYRQFRSGNLGGFEVQLGCGGRA